MQPSNMTPGRRAAGMAPSSADAAAGVILDVIPALVWFIRRAMVGGRATGLSVPQFRTLALLSHTPSASLSTVADNVGSSLPAASRLIGILVAKKLVVRRDAAHDRRELCLELTPRGAAVFAAARDRARRQLAEKLGGLRPRAYDRIGTGLAVLGDVFGTDAAPLLAAGGPRRARRGARRPA